MDKTFEKKAVTKKSENIADWYHDVVLRAGLADYAPVKGCMIIKPRGYALWEHAQKVLDDWFKKDGVQNAYFPMLIPMHLLQKEKEHIEGFSPELAVVTHGGGEELAEPLAIRPTSETVMYATFADWIHSYRDLPLKINQWCNILRWEKRTYPFLRTSEFLWQEGHTAHINETDAMGMVLRALEWYKRFYEEEFAISPYIGLKSTTEKFAGAERTYSVEIVLPDGKALQAATSHYLGMHFAKVFNVQFQDSKGGQQFAHQTSWGLSTRSIGGLVLVHGDDAGLIIPPRAAQTQVIVLVVTGKDETKNKETTAYAQKLTDTLVASGIRAKIDYDAEHSMGFRINEHELVGVPLRLEIGARETEEQTATWIRRDNMEKGTVIYDNTTTEINSLLVDIQTALLKKSKQMRADFTQDVSKWDEFVSLMQKQKMFLRAPWCESADCEMAIKEETKATPRVLELDRINEQVDVSCVKCGKPAHRHWLFAQSY